LGYEAYCTSITTEDAEQLASLSACFVDSFDGLSNVSNLKSLYVSNTNSGSKITMTSYDIRKLPASLETLTLNNIDLAPNTDFSSLSSLKELNLTNGAIISTNSVSVPLWMQEMKSLTPLFDVDNNYDVFSSSGGLFPPTLESISIAGRVNVSFPSFFESLILDGGDPLPHLTTVNLSGTNVYDFSSLPTSVTNLIVNEGSNVHGTPHFRDYATLPSSLTSLSLQNNINDLSVLPAHVPSLQYLDLSRSSEVDFFCQSITLFAIDIDSITKLTDLESLDLSNCGLSNDSLSKLADMPQLKELYINNTCENVCNSETYDYLKCQNVSDISSLSTLTNLTHLGLHGLESLDDISIIPTSFPALEFLDIGHIQEQISIQSQS
ncbi:hypothetical protein ADUPG1_000816, partial [Aduncisulcus paluster]